MAKLGENTQETLHRRCIDCLHLADRIGWLNAQIVAYAFWHDLPKRRKYAERLLAHLVEKRWFKPHVMPHRQLRCFTVTGDGQRYWKDASLDPAGRAIKPKVPGASYEHDTRAASALLFLAKGDIDRIIFDREIKAANWKSDTKGNKWPDGILLCEPHSELGWWVEVEKAHKTGARMRWQVEHMIQASTATDREDKLLLRLNRPGGGIVLPAFTTYLVVPESYNLAAFRDRVQNMLNSRAKDNEQIGFAFVLDTKSGFQVLEWEFFQSPNFIDPGVLQETWE